MPQTISTKCPDCSYIRYDLVHINHECGGLLIRHDSGDVECKLCKKIMSYNVSVTCGNCGYERTIDLKYLENYHDFKVYQMEVFQTIIIL